MDRLEGMRIVCEVADAGGFARAARTLHASPPAVTRAVAAIERAIGTRLFVRTTRSVQLTDAGRRYVDDCRRILLDIAEAEATAAGTHARPAGSITITAPALFGRLHVLPVVLAFLETHPAMQVHTLFVDRVTHLVEEGIDVAVRIANLPDSGLAASRVGTIRRVVCATPAYLAENGIPRKPEDLSRHRIVGREGLFGSNEWRFGDREHLTVAICPRLYCDTNDAALAAVLAGWGLSRFQSDQVAADVAAKRLRIVLAAHEEAPVPIHVVHTEGRRASARVRAFVDFCTGALRADRVLHARPNGASARPR